MSKRYDIDMTTGPFLKKILKFSLPLMLTGVLQLLYNTADVIVVGKFAGSDSLAAVGSTNSLINLIINVFLGLSMGSGVVIARNIGANDEKAVHNCTHTAMLMSSICGVFVCIFGFFMSRRMLVLMGSPDDVLPLSTLYLKIYFCGTPASLVYNFGASILRATGDTKRPMYILSSSGLINVVLNLVFVIIFGLGVAGVALATIISQYVSAIMIVTRLLHLENACKLDFKALAFHKAELLQILRVGIPAGIQSSLFSISNVIVQSTVNSFGKVAMAGITAGSNFDGYIYTCTNAIANTSMTFTSQNYGAKKYENIGRIYRKCLLFALFISLSMSSIIYLFANNFVSLFASEKDVIEIGVNRIKMVIPFYFFCSIMDVAGNQLRGMGKSLQPTIISLLGACGLRILWVWFVFPHDPSLTMLYWAYPFSWATTFFAHFIYYFIVNHQLKKINELSLSAG